MSSEEAAVTTRYRSSTRIKLLIAALTVSLIASSLIIWQREKDIESTRQEIDSRDRSISRLLSLESSEMIDVDPDLASLLAARAFRISATKEAKASLRNAAALPLAHRLVGHQDAVIRLAFSPDGRVLTSVGGSADSSRAVRLWDTANGRTRATIPYDPQTLVQAVAFSSSGDTLAAGKSDKTVQMWDMATGRPRSTAALDSSGLNTAQFSPDGRLYATSGLHKIQIWDTATGRLRSTLAYPTDDLIWAMQFTADGRTLATTSNAFKTVRLWDVPRGRLRSTLTGRQDSVSALAFSPDGRSLAVGGSSIVQVWDTTTGRPRTSLTGNQGNVQSVAFSPDGRTVAAGGWDNIIELWDSTNPEKPTADMPNWPHTTLAGHTGAVMSLAFSPDASTLASGSDDHTVRLWNLPVGRALSGSRDSVYAMAFSPDGRTLATTAGTAVRLWNTRTRRPRATLGGHENGVDALAFSPDSRSLAVASGDTVRLWNTRTRHLRTTLTARQKGIHAIAFSPDGHTLATGGDDHTTRIWDTSTGRVRATLTGHQNSVGSVAFSPDGRTLATAGDRTVRLWSMRTMRSRMVLQDALGIDGDTRVTFSPDGRTVAGSAGGAAWLWDTATGHRQRSRTEGLGTIASQDGTIMALTFSPDGHTFATASTDRRTRLWDTTTGRLRTTLTGHTGPVMAMALNKDGHVLATASIDHTVRLWDISLPTQEEAIDKICRSVGRDLTADERAKYLKGQPSAPACHQAAKTS
ncbi:WD40 repeat domain-containing protein [Streptomyces phaeochromogenes]|uniref:WD40 repeat domain-containing protein n=1 Tax=Streptomyces phaeochromogenes TaxID=1923 RepID=UPI0036B2D01C